GLVGPRLFGKVDSSKVKTADTQVKMLKASLQSYRLDVGKYPSTEHGLGALIIKPQDVKFWDGPYLEDELPLDPWNTPYVYQDGVDNLQGFALYSYGADNKAGGSGLDADVGYLP
ncbi:MAG: general secretion pathway protein G, partial [Candidatus Azotimanducaceae bacterium]